MRNKYFPYLKMLLTFLLLLLLSNKSYSQEEKFKALFIYNFTKYIEWPAEMGGENFSIAVLGNMELAKQLSDISGKMKIGNKKMNVIICKSIDEIPICQIVYFGTSRTDEIATFVAKVKGNKVLIIGDKDKACQKGACINFSKRNGNLNYDISKLNMEGANLKFNSTLTALGNAVD
jgi:hypothetical protein